MNRAALLSPPQGRIFSVRPEQRTMRSALHYRAVIDDDDLIDMRNRRQAVRDDQRRAELRQLADGNQT